MDPNFRKLTTKEKALKINLDERLYGTFAEIGAGQQVSDQFFRAGGASGTIAKTMSAYDMTFSDAIYGPCQRYVSEERLKQMLDKEFSLIIKRLTFRAKKTTFFAFSNTVEVINFKKTNNGQGWLGLRFQLHPNSKPNDCIIHVVLNDNESHWQQEIIGIVGVNLIYACFHYSNPDDFIISLVDNIQKGRLEIDMIKIEGPDFHHVDNRLNSLKLVKEGLTSVAMFGSNGKVMQPSETLYKKHILVTRGRFRPITLVNEDIMKGSLSQFKEELIAESEQDQNILAISELTLTDLTNDGKIDTNDFLDRVQLLCSIGQNVLISYYPEYYKLVAYLSKYNRGKKIGIVMGYDNLVRIFNEKLYKDLPGGIIEALGELLGGNSKLLIYPSIDKKTPEKLNTAHTFIPNETLTHFYQYLIDNKKIVDIQYVQVEHLNVYSDAVIELIKTGKEEWEKYVSPIIAEKIKQNNLFGLPIPLEVDTED
ncbi:MAG: hypothetical protein QM536_08995 [Chitinophagaceae bacterium]|nr:hypothetical protein [Chitinophagaceae bacterium]